MLIVHHLNQSRSHRILWLLEELSIPYDLKLYYRDKETMLAPPELKAIHPLGKSPVLENTETKEVIAESGAIVEVENPSSEFCPILFRLDDFSGLEGLGVFVYFEYINCLRFEGVGCYLIF
jgi:hypothetical protein